MNTVVGIVAIIAGGLCVGAGSINARLAEIHQRYIDILCREITALERFSTKDFPMMNRIMADYGTVRKATLS